ncbi:hypothetical protein ACLM5J_15300 [Nocardioides sp. Bht2]|uniref:hypothetical protein n=1 Tax=Nocardioides sp. Bht2 TaxID=3392297 RepID=UPI0039B6C3B8
MAGIGSVELFVLAVVALVALGLIARASARSRRGAEMTPVVRTTWWVCVTYGAVVVIGTLLGVLQVLTDDTVTVEAPIEEFWPQLPAGMTIDDGQRPDRLVEGAMTSATLTVSGLETSIRVVLAAAEAVSGLTIVAVVLVIGLACRNIGRGTPFAPVLARACGLAAGAVAIGSMVAQVLGSLGRSQAAEAALRWSSASWECKGKGCADMAPEQFVPAASFSVNLDLWPLAVALVLGVVAVVLRSGMALQRDTDGLV